MIVLYLYASQFFVLLFVQTSCMNLPGPQNSIYNELSWPIKLKLLKEYQPKTAKPALRRVGIEAYKMENVMRNDADNNINTAHTTPTDKRDERNIKMKLFRLMYETIHDNDAKIKRAEVIKKYYTNSTTFNIGYVMGEIADRYNVMTDIALTMKRLYVEWKPMEHINAYEQIANKAVELSHLADTVRNMAKEGPEY